MRRIVLTYGLIAGAILSAMMVLTIPFMDRIGFDRGAIIGFTTMVLAFLMIFFGVRSYRDTVGGGSVTFAQAFALGLLIALVATVCYVITWQLLYYQFMPDFADKYAAHAIEKARAAGASADELTRLSQEMDAFAVAYRNPLINIGYTFLEPLPVGFVLTAVTAAILGRKEKAPMPN
ncbi:DUF4199 domain-containing protein [Gemmatimonas aurantiaca]|uniref:DUF4199 domain-containing protein n=1 Tax=Gemmatimonas aurantiaca TaxID=173480 RepID=UPI00301D3A42